MEKILKNATGVKFSYCCIADNELVFLPHCSVCGELIRDFSMANINVIKEEGREPEAAGIVNGNQALQIIHGTVLFVHKPCDTGAIPWCPLENLLRSHQCYSFEREEVIHKSGL